MWSGALRFQAGADATTVTSNNLKEWGPEKLLAPSMVGVRDVLLLAPAGLGKETLTFSLCPLTLGSSYSCPPVQPCSLFTLIPLVFFSLLFV